MDNEIRRETIIDNDNFSVFLYPEIGIVYHVVKRSIDGDRFRDMMGKGADAFVTNKCTKYLSDDREIMSFNADDLFWAAENWEKRLMAAGWRHWALIIPAKILSRIMAKRLVARYIDLGIDVRTFKDEASALEWLTGLRD